MRAVVRIVYDGVALGGKTSCLHWVHGRTAVERRGRAATDAVDDGRVLVIEVTPRTLVTDDGEPVLLELATVGGAQLAYGARETILRAADAVVLVVDSQEARLDANVVELARIRTIVAPSVPLVVQHNKRDLPEVLPLERLRRALGVEAVDDFATIATVGTGVLDALRAAATRVPGVCVAAPG